MDDKELKELVEELLKQGIISLFDIYDMIRERINTDKAVKVRDMLGKHQSVIIPDIPESEIIDICRENKIKWQHAYDLHNSYEDGATDAAVKDMQNFMHQYGGIVIDNNDILKFYKAAYSRSLLRNNEIGFILENNDVNFRTIEHRVMITDEETGASGYADAIQKLYINKADYDRIINIPALQPYREFIFATDDISRISDVIEPREASIEEMVSRFCCAALKRKGVDSVYDPQTNHVHIDGEYIPSEIRDKFKGMGIMIETHTDHYEFLDVKEWIENGKEKYPDDDIDINREYDDHEVDEPSINEEELENEQEDNEPKELPEDLEDGEDKKDTNKSDKKVINQNGKSDDSSPAIEEREFDYDDYTQNNEENWNTADNTSESVSEDIIEDYFPEEDSEKKREFTEPEAIKKENDGTEYQNEKYYQDEYLNTNEYNNEEIQKQDDPQVSAEYEGQSVTSMDELRREENQRTEEFQILKKTKELEYDKNFADSELQECHQKAENVQENRMPKGIGNPEKTYEYQSSKEYQRTEALPTQNISDKGELDNHQKLIQKESHSLQDDYSKDQNKNHDTDYGHHSSISDSHATDGMRTQQNQIITPEDDGKTITKKTPSDSYGQQHQTPLGGSSPIHYHTDDNRHTSSTDTVEMHSANDNGSGISGKNMPHSDVHQFQPNTHVTQNPGKSVSSNDTGKNSTQQTTDWQKNNAGYVSDHIAPQNRNKSIAEDHTSDKDGIHNNSDHNQRFSQNDEHSNKHTGKNGSQQSVKDSILPNTDNNNGLSISKSRKNVRTGNDNSETGMPYNSSHYSDGDHFSKNETNFSESPLPSDTSKNISDPDMTKTKMSPKTPDEIRSVVYQESGYNRNYVGIKSSSSEAAYNTLQALDKFKKDAMRQTEYGTGKIQLSEVNQAGIAYLGKSWAKEKLLKEQDMIKTSFSNGECDEIIAVLKKHGFKGELDSDEGFANLYESAEKLLKKNDFSLEKYETNGYDALYAKKVMGVEKISVNAKFKEMFGTEDSKLAAKMDKQLHKIMRAGNKKKLIEQAKRIAPVKKKLRQMIKKNNDDTYAGFETLMSVKKGTENALRMAVKIRDAERTVRLKQHQNAVLHYNMKITKETQKLNNMAQSINQAKDPLSPDILSAKRKKDTAARQEHIRKMEIKKQMRAERAEKIQSAINKTEERRMWKKKKKTFVGKKEYKVHKIQKKLDLISKEGKSSFRKKRLERQLIKQQEKLTKRKSLKKALNTVSTSVRNRIQRTALYKAGAKVLAPVRGLFGIQQFITDLIKKALVALAPFILIGFLVIICIHIVLVTLITIYGCVMSVIPSMSAYDEQLTDPYDTPIGKTYTMLLDEEEKWITSIRKITEKEYTLDKFEDLIPWEAEVDAYNNQHHTDFEYDNNKLLVDALGIGDEYGKHEIKKVDGGQSIYFRNNNNPDSVSNIKDILTLCSVHYDDGFSDYEYEADNFIDDVKMKLRDWKDKAAEAIETAIRNIKNYFLKLLLGEDWGGPENLDEAHYNNEKNELAYGTYAKALFNASHDMTSQIETVISLDTAQSLGVDSWKQAVEDDKRRLRGEQNVEVYDDWEDFTIEGVRTACPKKWGCYESKEKFYYKDDGSLWTKDFGTDRSKDNIRLSSIVHTSTNCTTLDNDVEKALSSCWKLEKIDNPDYHDEDENGLDDENPAKPSKIQRFVHECKGHKGSYCGGHIVLKTTGIIHGMEGDMVGNGMSTNEEYEEEEHIPDNEPKIEDETEIKQQYVHAEDNIFEIDGYIEHAYVPSTWIGWTTTNIDAAYARYNQDWEFLYGIDVQGTSVIESRKRTLSNQEIYDILKQVSENERLEPKTRDKLQLALEHVGVAGYNQTYHGLLFEENGGDNYHDSDCSGFASNVWYDELGRTIRSCANLVAWGRNNGVLKDMCNGGYEPGDIIVNIGGRDEDGELLSNHAVIYVGTFDGQIWGAECTSSNGGGIFYMKRANSWYLSSYYLDMTP